MERIPVTSLKDAARYLPLFGVLQVGLALKQGHTVTVVDEARDVEYIFEPSSVEESKHKEETT